MRKTKILTIEDLVKFCHDHNFTEFSSKDSGYSLHVQVPCESFEATEDEDPLTLFANVRLMHTGKNRNQSNLTEKGAKSCLSKIAYKPVLADFTDVNGERDFTYHAIEFNEDGSRVYIERQVGCFTSDKPYMEQDPDHSDRKYIYAKVAIPREYTDAAEIIERKGGTKVSAELAINEMSYSIDDGLLLEDVDVMGCTLLGTDPQSGEIVLEGMENAFLQIEDFSAENNSVIDKSQLINEITAAVLSKLDYKMSDDITDNTNGKEVSGLEKEKLEFEETEVKTTEEASATETPEVVEEETFVEETEDVSENSEKNPDEVSEEDQDDADEEPEVVEDFDETPSDESPEEESEDDHQSVSAIEDEDSTGTRVENSLNYSVTVNGVTKEFAVSLQDKINSVTILVNETYGESDCTYYDVEVFEDDGKYCVMHDWWNNKHYKQEYSVKKDVYSLKGDRVQVYAQYLTQDEISQLDKMKSNYSAVETELNSYKEKEVHTQREAVINSEDYSLINDVAEFADLKCHMDEYTPDELANKADLIYAKFMKSNYSNFSSVNDQKKHSMVFMTSGSNTVEEKLPYGGLFKNFKGKK